MDARSGRLPPHRHAGGRPGWNGRCAAVGTPRHDGRTTTGGRRREREVYLGGRSGRLPAHRHARRRPGGDERRAAIGSHPNTMVNGHASTGELCETQAEGQVVLGYTQLSAGASARHNTVWCGHVNSGAQPSGGGMDSSVCADETRPNTMEHEYVNAVPSYAQLADASTRHGTVLCGHVNANARPVDDGMDFGVCASDWVTDAVNAAPGAGPGPKNSRRQYEMRASVSERGGRRGTRGPKILVVNTR